MSADTMADLRAYRLTLEADQKAALDAANVRPVPACPNWCELPNGHPWDGVNVFDRRDVERTHTLTVFDGITIVANEAMDIDGNRWWRWFGPDVDLSCDPDEDGPDDLDECARAFAKAAEILRSLPAIDCAGEAVRQARYDSTGS